MGLRVGMCMRRRFITNKGTHLVRAPFVLHFETFYDFECMLYVLFLEIMELKTHILTPDAWFTFDHNYDHKCVDIHR